MRYIDRLRRTQREEAPLLPVMRPHDWPLFVQCVYRSLLTFQPGVGVPLVALGRPRGNGFDMVRRDAVYELGMSEEDLEIFAVQNLSRIPTELEVVHRGRRIGRRHADREGAALGHARRLRRANLVGRVPRAPRCRARCSSMATAPHALVAAQVAT